MVSMAELTTRTASVREKDRIYQTDADFSRELVQLRFPGLPYSGYNEVWDQARKAALTPRRCRAPLGRRPYDLRHPAVSLRLNSGVPAAPGTASRSCSRSTLTASDGQATAANQRIADALGTQETEPDSGSGSADGTEQIGQVEYLTRDHDVTEASGPPVRR